MHSGAQGIKKKVKVVEVVRLKTLPLKDIMKMIPDTKDIIFKLFLLGRPREPKVYILHNINATDLLALLYLFIPPKIFITITENTNLYAITNNAPIALTLTSRQYWWPTNVNEIRIFYGIFYYMKVHREPNYKIY